MPRMFNLFPLVYERRVFTTVEAIKRTGLPRGLVFKQLAYFQERGLLHKIRRGLYVPTPYGTGIPADRVSPYVVAGKLRDTYALSYHTALELHGVAQSSAYKVYVTTPNPFRTFEFQEVTYRAIKAKPGELEMSGTSTTVEDQEIRHTNREWTIAQCALRLELAGGLEEYLKSIAGFSYVKFEPLYSAAVFLGRKTLFNRLGFVLSLFKERWKVADEDLSRFRSAKAPHVQYFGAKPGRGRFVKEWNLMVPHNLEQVIQPA